MITNNLNFLEPIEVDISLQRTGQLGLETRCTVEISQFPFPNCFDAIVPASLSHTLDLWQGSSMLDIIYLSWACIPRFSLFYCNRHPLPILLSLIFLFCKSQALVSGPLSASANWGRRLSLWPVRVAILHMDRHPPPISPATPNHIEAIITTE